MTLRDFEPADLDAYADWLRPGHEWRRWDGPYHQGPSEEQIAQRVARLRRGTEKGDWPEPRRRLVIAEPATNLLVGHIARYWVSRKTCWAAVGIDLFDPRHWGRGLGHEALGLWIDYLFREEPRFVRLDMRTWSGNQRMMRLAEKLGGKLEARFRGARIVDAKHYDALGYGVLRAEWEARFPAGFDG